MKSKRYAAAALVAAGIAGTFAVAAPAFADTPAPAPAEAHMPGMGMPGGMRRGGMPGKGRMPGVFGTVSSVSGTTIVVSSKMWAKPASEGSAPSSSTVSYTVDASAATVTKNGAASSVSAIAAGDTVMVAGTVTGTNVVATAVRDGMPPRPKPKEDAPKGPMNQDMIIQGNGQPLIGGTVTAVNGTALTVTNKSNVTYSVDATNAKVEKSGASSSVSAIAVGDSVLVQGTVNGTSVTASSVIDQQAMPAGGSGTSTPPRGGAGRGFFGAIGNFFGKLFGF